MSERFQRFALSASSLWAVAKFCVFVELYCCGPQQGCLHYSDTWQLIVNTRDEYSDLSDRILNSARANRDAQSIRLKLDELLRVFSGRPSGPD